MGVGVEVCLACRPLRKRGREPPLWPGRRGVLRPWVCLEGRGTRCVSSWPVDSIGRVWGHLPSPPPHLPSFPFLFYKLSQLSLCRCNVG